MSREYPRIFLRLRVLGLPSLTCWRMDNGELVSAVGHRSSICMFTERLSFVFSLQWYYYATVCGSMCRNDLFGCRWRSVSELSMDHESLGD